MRGHLATAAGYRSPPPSRAVIPHAEVSAGREPSTSPLGDPCATAHGQAWVGPGRSCLFSPREKIEMRGHLATTAGYRSPSPSRSVTPVSQTSPLGEPERGPRRQARRARRSLPAGPLSRWGSVGVRAGGGGGRATLLKPARRVTQRSPLGEHHQPLSPWERLRETRAGTLLLAPAPQDDDVGPPSHPQRPHDHKRDEPHIHPAVVGRRGRRRRGWCRRC